MYAPALLPIGNAADSETKFDAEDKRMLMLSKPLTVEELCTIPDMFWYPLGLWLGLEERVLRGHYYYDWECILLNFHKFKLKKRVLDVFQHHLIESTKLSELTTGSLYHQILENSYMTMEKADEIVEQIEDSNRESVRSCLQDMLLQREEKITSALVKMGLKETAEDKKGKQ